MSAAASEILEQLQRLQAENAQYFHQLNELFVRNCELERDLAAALKGRLLVPLLDVQRDLCRMSTRVTLDLPYCDFDAERDRQTFRRKLAAQLRQMGDTFMTAWDQLHPEPPVESAPSCNSDDGPLP